MRGIVVLIKRHAMIVRYVIAGGTAALVDLILLYVGTEVFHVWYLSSAIFAFTIAFIVSFLMQKFWAFRDSRTDGMHGQLLSYLFVLIFNMGVNTTFIYILVEHGNQHYLIAQIISGAVIALWSFFIYRRVIFHEGASDVVE
ncbi:MAG TPA: GtrA family protein [Candidatus Paceibacterota bacterium]